VRFDADALGTAKTQGSEVLLRGHIGTVVSLMGSEAAVVKWDPGEYEVYGDLVPSSSGMKAVSSGTVTIEAFEAPVHTDYLLSLSG
jgi:hypothetical protein